MGILTGIYSSKEPADNLRHKLNQMLAAQRHRDMAEPEVLQGDLFSFGMANQHNWIYSDSRNNFESLFKDVITGIYAFVDGIVLDVPKLKRFFESCGYSLSISSCSSIVSAAYHKWGIDFMNHLEGEFSCAVWDEKTRKIVLARDPYGHKPLHYWYDGTTFIFSSEIKGILAAGIDPQIDLISLSEYLSLNCIPSPKTIFKNIMQVYPGGMIIVDLNTQRCISTLYETHKPSVDQNLKLNDAVLYLTDKIRNAVAKRMVTKDIYCFLSGGIDSSALISFASEVSNKPVNAITVGFEEEEKNEISDAEIMADHVKASHHKIIARPDSFQELLDTIVFHHDSPFTDTSNYPTYFAAKLARNYTDIILTGDGPDQTLGGSGHHVFAVKHHLFSPRNPLKQKCFKNFSKFLSKFSKSPVPSLFSKLERKLYRDSLSPVHAAYDLRSCFPNIVKKYLCSEDLWEIHQNNDPYRHPESWFKKADGGDDINNYLFSDVIFYVPEDLMIKVDRMCMAHGLETLSPFQDIQLAKLVKSLPGRYKIHVSEDQQIITKYILRKVCEHRFPKQTLAKKKQGFGIPVDKWLKQDQGKFIRDILLNPRSLNRGYFKKESLKVMTDIFITGQGDYFFPSANGIVGLLTLELWHRKYLD